MGKNVLITGTSAGIGLEIEKKLSAQGHNVFGCARRKCNKENYIELDLAEDNAAQKLFDEAKKYFGNIDILINNAGVYEYVPIENKKTEDIKYEINLNFKVAYELCALAIPDMKKNHWGRIVNIGSISAVVGEANATLYSSTKAALMGLTKSLALEVAPYGITVNQINPGWVKTDLLKDDNVCDMENLDVIPQKRYIEPAEIADLVIYIISNGAMGLTGQGINLCAGLSCGC